MNMSKSNISNVNQNSPKLSIQNLLEQDNQNSEYNIFDNDDESSIISAIKFGNNFNMNKNLYYIERQSESPIFNFFEKSTSQEFNSIFSNTFPNNISLQEEENDEKEVHLLKKNSKEIKIKKDDPSHDFLNHKTKREKKCLFYVDNNSDKYGNNLKDISGRKDNLRSKIIRQFIQNIVYKWITNKDPEKKDKLKSIGDYIKSFKHKKSVKLSEIYKFSEVKIDEIIKIKLNFTLEQAFKCFSKSNQERVNILSSNLRQMEISSNINEDEFFSRLDKQNYINWLIKKGSSPKKVYKVLENILKELGDSEGI